MSDDDLMGDEAEAPKKKRGLPKWLIGCGCGCTIVIIILSALLVWGGMRMRDPKVQWPAMKETLHFDERPADLEMQFGMNIPFVGQEMFTLTNIAEGYTVSVHSLGGSTDLEELFKTEGDGFAKVAIPKNATLGETEVQGRLVRSMTDTGMPLTGAVVGAGIRIDLSMDGRYRVIELRVIKGKSALTEEQITEFFSNFDVWHE